MESDIIHIMDMDIINGNLLTINGLLESMEETSDGQISFLKMNGIKTAWICVQCHYESNTFLDFIKKDFDLNEDKTKRYEIIKEFQKGGFGNIFLAYDNKEKREVVIKK